MTGWEPGPEKRTSTDPGAGKLRTRPLPQCPLCGAAGRPLYRSLRDRLYAVPGDWSLAACTSSACGLWWLDPMPVTEDLHLAYQTYFTHSQAGDGDAGHVPSGIRGLLRSLRDHALRFRRLGEDIDSLALLTLGSESPGRVLELGAGDGTRLRRLRDLGWTVEGQDVDPRAHVFRLAAEGVKVYLGVLETLDLPSACYDAIVMSHVIEHVPDPVETLRTCARLLKPGGKFAAVTPNTASFGSRRYGSDWMALDPPRHLHLFNPRNLADTARRAGYARVDVRTTGANGAGVALGSRFIRDTGRYKMGGVSRNASESAAIVLIQALEGLAPSLGEECILSAWTQPS